MSFDEAHKREHDDCGNPLKNSDPKDTEGGCPEHGRAEDHPEQRDLKDPSRILSHMRHKNRMTVLTQFSKTVILKMAIKKTLLKIMILSTMHRTVASTDIYLCK